MKIPATSNKSYKMYVLMSTWKGDESGDTFVDAAVFAALTGVHFKNARANPKAEGFCFQNYGVHGVTNLTAAKRWLRIVRGWYARDYEQRQAQTLGLGDPPPFALFNIYYLSVDVDLKPVVL